MWLEYKSLVGLVEESKVWLEDCLVLGLIDKIGKCGCERVHLKPWQKKQDSSGGKIVYFFKQKASKESNYSKTSL